MPNYQWWNQGARAAKPRMPNKIDYGWQTPTMGAAPPVGNAPVQTPGWGDVVRTPGQGKSLFPPTGGEEPMPPGGANPPVFPAVQTSQFPQFQQPSQKPAPGFTPQPAWPSLTPGGPYGVGSAAFGFTPQSSPNGASASPDAFIATLSPQQQQPLRQLLSQGVSFDQAYRMTMPRTAQTPPWAPALGRSKG